MDKHSLYMNALSRVLQSCDSLNAKEIQLATIKAVFVGVKAVCTKPEKHYLNAEEELKWRHTLIDIVKSLMAILTPTQFEQLFPIAKEYEGERYGVKDYFYTRRYLDGLDSEQPIGEKIWDFLWEYHNWDIADFVVETMQTASDLRRLDGLPGLAEEFASMYGLKTYTLHTDSNGKQFLLDNQTGKTAKLRKKRPKHLKLVKGKKGVRQ